MKPPKLNFQELQSIIAIEQSIEDSNFPLKRDLRNAVAKIKSICLKDDKELEEKLEGSSIKLYNLGDTLRLDE